MYPYLSDSITRTNNWCLKFVVSWLLATEGVYLRIFQRLS